jgi:hypothetical protein
MNHYVGHGGTSSYTQGVDIDVLEGLWLFHRIATIKEPSSILVFIDTFEDSINHRLFVIDARPEGIVLGWNHVPAARTDEPAHSPSLMPHYATLRSLQLRPALTRFAPVPLCVFASLREAFFTATLFLLPTPVVSNWTARNFSEHGSTWKLVPRVGPSSPHNSVNSFK